MESVRFVWANRTLDASWIHFVFFFGFVALPPFYSLKVPSKFWNSWERQKSADLMRKNGAFSWRCWWNESKIWNIFTVHVFLSHTIGSINIRRGCLWSISNENSSLFLRRTIQTIPYDSLFVPRQNRPITSIRVCHKWTKKAIWPLSGADRGRGAGPPWP